MSAKRLNPSVTLPATVEKIKSHPPREMVKARINIEDGADPLYKEVRIENTLTTPEGKQVGMRESQSRAAERRRRIQLVARLAALERNPEKYRAMCEVISRALGDEHKENEKRQAQVDAA